MKNNYEVTNNRQEDIISNLHFQLNYVKEREKKLYSEIIPKELKDLQGRNIIKIFTYYS